MPVKYFERFICWKHRSRPIVRRSSRKAILRAKRWWSCFRYVPAPCKTTVTVGYFPTRRSAAKSSTRVLRSKRFWTETIVNHCDNVLSNSTGDTQCRPYCFYFIVASIVSESFSYRVSTIAKHPSRFGLAPLFVRLWRILFRESSVTLRCRVPCVRSGMEINLSLHSPIKSSLEMYSPARNLFPTNRNCSRCCSSFRRSSPLSYSSRA